VDGGLGTDTFLAANLRANNIEGGTSDSNGVVINMGSSAVTSTAVLSKVSSFTADSVTSVGGGEYAYTFAASLTANTAVTGSITNVENITGTAGADYIVASSTANVINGNGGSDYIVLDTGGGDTVTVVGTAAGGSAGTVAGFTVGTGGDIIDFTTNDAQMAATDPTTVFDTNTTIDDTTGIIIHGTTVTQGASATVAQATAGLTVGSFDGAGTTNDTVYIAYDDASNTYVGILDSDAGDDGFNGDTLTILLTIEGLADATTLTAANFADFA
jgi:hypothetical protein